MPPKRGRGRGRGVPRTEEPCAPPGRGEDRPLSQQRPPPPPGFFAQASESEETVRHEVADPSSKSDQKRQKKKEIPIEPEALGMEFKKMTVAALLPRRPDVGNLGKSIKLVANCFPVKIPSGNVYHYDVEIISKRRSPESGSQTAGSLPAGADKKDKKYRCLSTKKNREIINLMLETDRHFHDLYAAYDGQKNLYTRKPLNISLLLKCEVIIPDENPGNPDDPRGPRQDVFEVQIKPVKKKDTSSCAISLDSLHALFEGRTHEASKEAVMALETVLRHGPCLRFTPVGRSFFYPPERGKLHPLGGGREVWFGYHQSLRLGQWKPMVNIDITATTFYEKGPLLQYIANILNTTVNDLGKVPRISDADIRRISNELKNLRIEVNHLRNYKRKYRIIRLVKESASRLEFPLTTNGGATVRTTVARYFKEQHNLTLRFPNLPCIQVNPETKKVYLPIEVCDVIQGQHCKKKLDERQNAEMIKITARAPRDRFKEIEDIIKKANFDNDPFVREFDLDISPQPLRLEGRILDAPTVRYKDKDIRPEDNGSWKMERIQFFRGAEIDSWALLNFASPQYLREENLNRFAQLLVQIGREVGIAIQRPNHIENIDGRRCNIKNLITDMKNKYKVTLVVVIVPARIKHIYGDVKQAAETHVGLTTQCIKDENARSCKPAVISNLCQKINAKMGGVNNSLVPGQTPAILRKPVIIIGADVTHPGPSHDIKPSLAACVGSLDAYPSRYAVTCRAQTNVNERKESIEIILDLKSMVVDLLKAFYRNTNGKKPEKIIFYRDGVSEGQFEKVRDHEVKCIREACMSLSPDYQPGITFIVVQKRHHTRFMPQDPRDGRGKMKNVPPGTTVDTIVTHPVNFDFFLCSHFGLQGTSRPSHYTVIEDDNNFSSNDLQKLTYYLCHTYVRCTKSISTPAPVQYAHLAAYRARQHLSSQIEESTTSSDTSSTYHALPQAVIEAIKVVDQLKSTMYFV